MGRSITVCARGLTGSRCSETAFSTSTASASILVYRSNAAGGGRATRAQDVAGAADLQVRQRDLEPGAKLGRVEDRLQALPGNFAQLAALAVQQVGVCAPRGSDCDRATGRAAPGRASARSMTIVLAFGMSSPDSMIVVQTRTSNSPRENDSITFSSCPSPIWP